MDPCSSKRLSPSLEKALAEPGLLNTQIYFLQRKKMAEARSLGRLEWVLSNLVIFLLFYGASLPECPKIVSIV